MKPDQTVEQTPHAPDAPVEPKVCATGLNKDDESEAKDTSWASDLKPSGREIAISSAFTFTLIGLALTIPIGLASLLSHYLLNRFPEDAFYSYHNDVDYLKGLDTFMPWFLLLMGYAVGLTRRAVIPVLMGIVGFIFMSDHAEIVQAIVAHSAASK